MNNKNLGTEFEREMCDKLKELGFWVHFISPDATGAQPFDVIATKKGIPVAIDCKTSVRSLFSISRLEYNQIFAFERWLNCGNRYAVVAVKYKDEVYFIPYEVLKKGSVKLGADVKMEEWFNANNSFK